MILNALFFVIIYAILNSETTMGCDVKKEEVYQNGSIMESYQW